MVETNRGKHTMDDIRKIGEDLQDEIYTGLLQAFANGNSRVQNAPDYGSWGGGAVPFPLLATFDIGRATSRARSADCRPGAANSRTTASRDLLHTTLTSIGDAVVATDGAGRVTFMNGVAEGSDRLDQAQARGTQASTRY